MGLGRELLDGIRQGHYARLDEAAFDERIVGIEKAVAALCEADVDEEKIISLLQKHWDLRLSEANEFLRHEKQYQERIEIMKKNCKIKVYRNPVHWGF